MGPVREVDLAAAREIACRDWNTRDRVGRVRRFARVPSAYRSSASPRLTRVPTLVFHRFTTVPPRRVGHAGGVLVHVPADGGRRGPRELVRGFRPAARRLRVLLLLVFRRRAPARPEGLLDPGRARPRRVPALRAVQEHPRRRGRRRERALARLRRARLDGEADNPRRRRVRARRRRAADDDDAADADARTIAAAVSALAFDGTTIVAATHEGFVHTWRLMARGQKRGYVRLLQPLRVDGVPVTKARILGEPGSKLLACHAPSKRAFVVWELDTGKLRGAFNTDGVARGVPLLLVESCATVMACVHADADFETERSQSSRAPVAALLDVKTGEGGALRDSRLLLNKGTPTCAAFDGELFVVATSLGVLIAWNLQTGDAPAMGAHAGAANAAAVGAVKVVPGEPSRILSGGADRALLLWDKALRPLARLELGSPVTCLAVSTPRLAVAGTQDGFVEVVSLPAPDDAEPDQELVEARRAKTFLPTEDFDSADAGVVPAYRYALRHDPGSAPSSFASFDAFTRRVPVWEGAYVPPREGEAARRSAGPEDAGGSSRRSEDKENASSSSGFSASRALAGTSRTDVSPEEEASRVKREEEEARAKQRAMDGAGVARDPNVRATADSARCCSNPTCVAREDTLGSGRSMLRCSRCKSARYCSTHCQRTHWRDGHKGKCVAPGEATAKETPAAPAPAPPARPQRRRRRGARWWWSPSRTSRTRRRRWRRRRRRRASRLRARTRTTSVPPRQRRRRRLRRRRASFREEAVPKRRLRRRCSRLRRRRLRYSRRQKTKPLRRRRGRRGRRRERMTLWTTIWTRPRFRRG